MESKLISTPQGSSLVWNQNSCLDNWTKFSNIKIHPHNNRIYDHDTMLCIVVAIKIIKYFKKGKWTKGWDAEYQGYYIPEERKYSNIWFSIESLYTSRTFNFIQPQIVINSLN